MMDYVAPDLCIGCQYLNISHILISPLVANHTIHSSFKYNSTLLEYLNKRGLMECGLFAIPIPPTSLSQSLVTYHYRKL